MLLEDEQILELNFSQELLTLLQASLPESSSRGRSPALPPAPEAGCWVRGVLDPLLGLTPGLYTICILRLTQQLSRDRLPVTGPSDVTGDVSAETATPGWPAAGMILGWFQFNHILASISFLSYKTSRSSLGPSRWL